MIPGGEQLMQSLNDISIKRKLILVTMLAVMTALALACTAFVVNDVSTVKKNLINHMSALANVLSVNSANKLRRHDQNAAAQVLASLTAYPSIHTAAIFDASGNVFATYPLKLQPEMLPNVSEIDGVRFHHDRLEIIKPISQADGQLGTFYLACDLELIWQHMIQYTLIVVGVFLVACGASYLLAFRLQRVISGPVLNLTRAAQEISRKNDYSIRVCKSTKDELGTLCDEFNHMLNQIETGKAQLELAQQQLERRVEERTRQLSEANAALSKQVHDRLRAEEELKAMHGRLVDAARRAGMAEIATGVLHNVGNVLTSINVSANLLRDRLSQPRTNDLVRVVDLLDQHADNLGEFIANTPKGKLIPSFLKMLAEDLSNNSQALIDESHTLIANLEHVKSIVATQQSYASAGGYFEPTEVNELLDDAVKLIADSFDRYSIEIRKEYGELPPLLLDKQRLMLVFTNLVKNAKEAMLESPKDARVLTLRTEEIGDRLVISVGDTGVGVLAENLSRIFSHGFTTKAFGHGFGLHNCANAAAEMDGSLSVQSGGEMKGATFILNLPFRPVLAIA